MKCRWKNSPWKGWIILWIWITTIAPTFQQGGRRDYTGVSGQSIVPGGFQPQLYSNQFPSSINRNARVIPQTATSVQNTEFGFYPTGPSSTNSNFRGVPVNSKPLVQSSFIGVPCPQQQQQSIKQVPRQQGRGEVQYEYYDEPEEDIIYQYGTDVNDQGNGQKTVVGKEIAVQDGQRQDIQSSQKPLNILTGRPNFFNNLPTQTITTAQLGTKSNLRNRQPFPIGPSGFSRETSSFIPLSDNEDPDPLLALNGRSVHPSNPRFNNLPIRPPNALLRSTAPSSTVPPTPPTASDTSGPSGGSSEKPQRSRGSFSRNANTSTTTTPRSVPRATSRRSNIPRGGNRFTITSRPTPIQKEKLNENIIPSSSTFRPESVQEKLRRTDTYILNGATTSSSTTGSSSPTGKDASAASDDYTIEYVEYPASPEDENGDKSAFEYYEVSEETAKAIIANRTKATHLTKTHPKGKNPINPNTKVTGSSSMSVSSKSSSTIATTSTTTPKPSLSSSSSSEEEEADNNNEKAKVIISVSTTKSISGSKLNKETVTRSSASVKPTPTKSSRVIASVQTSQSVVANDNKKPTQRDGNKVVQVTDGIKDSVPSGAETSPEYYEEEYSYPDNFPVLNQDGVSNDGQDSSSPVQSTLTSVSSSSSSRESKATNVHNSGENINNNNNNEESEEAEEEVQQQQQQKQLHHHAQPQARKLPSKTGEIQLGHFETLVDFGDLESDQRIPIVHDQNLEEDLHSSSTTTTTTSTTTTTTTETPKLVPIKFAEISPSLLNLLPPGFKFPPSEVSSTTPSQSPNTTPSVPISISFDEIPSFLLPKGYKPLGTSAPFITSSTTTTTTSKPKVVIEDIPASLLPKGYKPLGTSAPIVNPSRLETEPPKNPLEALLSKVKFKEIAIPGLVPKDFKPPPLQDTIKFETPANLLPPGYKPPTATESPTPIKFEIPANLLPAGYKPPVTSEAGENTESITTKKSPTGGLVFPTRPPSGGGVVFPTKPGGFRSARPSTTEGPKADTPPPPRVTIAAAGWPTRKTTEFTGWPTTSTTPAPSTSTVSTTSTSTTEAPTTTTVRTTTTTPPPPKRSKLGTCPNEVCRLEATIRIIGGAKWKPEFSDINTEEYKHLELTVRRELDGAYRASGLAPWYKRVQIESFNPGSVLVDYFVELEKIDRELTTTDVVKVFHKSLLDSDPGDELPLDTEAPGALRFGRFNIDPRYTDFKVVNMKSGKNASEPEPLIPQWAIAVIIIGLVSLLFVIILAVIVLVSRFKNSKKKNTVSLTQEMLNEFNKSHMAVGGGGASGGVDNFGADDLYNMDDVWNDKQMDRTFDRRPTKRSQGSTKGSANYNIYDSWKTEWNGYYGNGNYYGDSGYAPSRRRSDYDTNF